MHFLFSKSTTWKRLHKFCSVHDLKYCTVTNNYGSCTLRKVWKWLADAHARSMTPHEVGKSFDFLVHLAPFQPAFGFKGFRFWEEFAVSKHSKQISLNMSLQEKRLNTPNVRFTVSGRLNIKQLFSDRCSKWHQTKRLGHAQCLPRLVLCTRPLQCPLLSIGW